ncbi:MAG TPA: hypothetical protein VNA04_14970 [Thermoanaerobaculia bacterium]|nr:hypothetical protein [Thermoanaerobaculia bacterium]
MARSPLFLLLLLLAIPAPAGVKVAGAEFVPKDLIFAAADSKSQASAEGSLPKECQWTFLAQTRIGRQEDSQRCVRFYYKTTVTLVQSCPAKDAPAVRRLAERITATSNRCPDASGRLVGPESETRAISSGTTVDGKQQDIVRQPDGTRITLSYDATAVAITAAFPDGTTDVLKLP